MSNQGMTAKELHQAWRKPKRRTIAEAVAHKVKAQEGANAGEMAGAGAFFSGKANKYGAKKVRTEEGVFDSKMEYKRWCELKLLQAAGTICNLERQIPYVLEMNGVKIGRFTADHRWQNPVTGVVTVEDVKGCPARDFILRVKMMKAIHGIDVQVWPERKRKKQK